MAQRADTGSTRKRLAKAGMPRYRCLVSTSPTARFLELTGRLAPEEWGLLGLLSIAPRVARSSLEQAVAGDIRKIRSFIEQQLAAGLLADAGKVRQPLAGRGWGSEPSFSLPFNHRVLTLRRLADARRLDELERLASRWLPPHPEIRFSLPLFAGDLPGLRRAASPVHWSDPGNDEAEGLRALLRHALCSPFDASWLERSFGDAASTLAEQVLLDAVDAPAPVGELYEWLLLQRATTPQCRRLLAEHAILRFQCDRADELCGDGSERDSCALTAANAYLRGNLGGAQKALDRSLTLEAPNTTGSRGSNTPNAGGLAPLLALLAASRAGPDSHRLAKRLVKLEHPQAGLWGRPPGLESSARALRTLLANLRKPEARRARQDVHQLPARTPAWELLLRGLDVQLHERNELTRRAWARRLDASGREWAALGYEWLARQADFLAQSLDPADSSPKSMPPRAHELALGDLVQPLPEWQKTLSALESFVRASEKQSAPTSVRVAWFVDMVAGTLAKPALQEFRPGTGWTAGRRMNLDDLAECSEHLPPEDAVVVQAVKYQRAGSTPQLQALDALVGHPRVFNGARGRLPVEVVRGECRVETRQERGHLLVVIEPANASLGVNVVVESETRLRVLRVPQAMARLIELLPSGLRVPDEHAGQLLPLLGQLASHVPVDCEQLSAHEHLSSNSKPCFRISPVSGAFSVELGVRPFGADGRFFPAGVGRAALTVYRAGRLLSTQRDLLRERERCRQLWQGSATLKNASAREAEDDSIDIADLEPRWLLGEEDLFRLLAELGDQKADCELEWQNQRPLRSRGRLALAQLQGKLRPIKGWYLATGGVDFDDATQFELSALIQMPFTRSGRFLRLPNGDFVEVERRARRVLAALAAAANGHERGAVRLSPLAIDALRVLSLPRPKWQVAPELASWLERIDQVQRQEPELPAGLLADFRDYQLEGYRWLWRLGQLGLGACLADDMGLGKTLQAIGLLLSRAGAGPQLVVTPTSVAANWLSELERFSPSLRVAEYAGKQRARLIAQGSVNADVLVTSYALLQQDAEPLSAIAWQTVVLDEAQFIKNPHSARAKAAFRLQADCRVALTGTPVENHLGDLWSIFRFLNPTLLGPYKQFFHRFLRPIERDQDNDRAQELRSLLKPFLLRRSKAQVLSELPPLTVVRHDVQQSEDEALRYAILRKQIHEKLRTAEGKRDNKLQILAELTRLRRFCCHPRLVFPDADHHSSKVETLLDLVEELRENGHRALVFSQFVDFLTLVRERLDERQIVYQYLDGSSTRRGRQAAVTAFQSGVGDLFLVSLKAGGFGLNLAAADYVIQLDPWWNPAVEAQATDRAHRIGQERPVTVYRLVTRNSIEERIEDLQQGKRSLARQMLSDVDVPTKLSERQLIELMG